MSLNIRPLHSLFAAEISNVALSPDLGPGEVAAINEAMNEHAVLIFRDQNLADEKLLGFGRLFGEMASPRNHRAGRRIALGEVADISNLDQAGEIRRRDDHRRLDALGNQLWHSDASFRPISGALSMLYGVVIPPKGGDTEFADLRAAYDALDDETKELVENLDVVHSIFHSRGQLGHTDYTEAERAVLPDVKHPLVRTHPSGRKTLYMGAHASHIIDWPLPEGKLLLRDLMEHAVEPRFRYRHSWRKGDLVIWDNRCTLHRGHRYDDINYTRDLRRVTTQDTASLGDNPELVAAQ